MVQTQKQIHSLTEQDREPGNKPLLIWSINPQQRVQNYKMENDSLFNKWCLENWTDSCKKKKKKDTGSLSHTIYNKFKTETIKIPEENRQ